MQTTGLTYLFLFLPLALVLFYNPIYNSVKYRKLLLIALSVVFYLLSEPLMVFLLLVAISFNYFAVSFYIKNSNRLYAYLAIGFDVVLLLGFKYIRVVLSQLGYVLPTSGVMAFVMPLGLSYYSFSCISYVMDILKDKKLQGSFADVVLYIIFWGKIVTGPVEQYANVFPQIESNTLSASNIGIGAEKFAIGLIKKVLIADSIAPIVNNIFGLELNSVAYAWIGGMLFSLQLYYDFSGCTDMAIGVSRMFGYSFMENFNHPYAAKSVIDFWKRWHISLTKWFTKYLYIPLGGNRVSSLHHIGNMFIVWLATGIWHGASVSFIIWGLLQFVFCVVEKYTGLNRYLERTKLLGRIYLWLFAIISWSIFRCGNYSSMQEYLSVMFGFTAMPIVIGSEISTLCKIVVPLIMAVVFSFQVYSYFKTYIVNNIYIYICIHCITLILFILSLAICVTNGSNSILALYANF